MNDNYKCVSLYSNCPGSEHWDTITFVNNERVPIALDTFFGPIKVEAKHQLTLPNILHITNAHSGRIFYYQYGPADASPTLIPLSTAS